MKRYKLFTHDDGDGFPYTDEELKTDGEWVKYTDHKAVVEIYKDKISSLEENRLAQFDLLTNQKNKIEELEKERFDFAHAYYAHVKDDELIKKAFGILRGD
jgi:hypothetical protein